MKKYKLTEETINVYGITLFRIEALIAFKDVSIGDKGGFLEKEENLNQSGNAWVYDNAMVSGNAMVFDNAMVSGNARVFGNARVSGNARVFGNARVSGNAIIKNKGNTNYKSYITIGPIGNNRFITYEKSAKIINAGCFSGTIEEFEKAVMKKYGNESDYYPVIELIKNIETK